MMYCKEHKGELSTLICKRDWKLMCFKCYGASHKDHLFDIITLNSLIEEIEKKKKFLLYDEQKKIELDKRLSKKIKSIFKKIDEISKSFENLINDFQKEVQDYVTKCKIFVNLNVNEKKNADISSIIFQLLDQCSKEGYYLNIFEVNNEIESLFDKKIKIIENFENSLDENFNYLMKNILTKNKPELIKNKDKNINEIIIDDEILEVEKVKLFFFS